MVRVGFQIHLSVSASLLILLNAHELFLELDEGGAAAGVDWLPETVGLCIPHSQTSSTISRWCFRLCWRSISRWCVRFCCGRRSRLDYCLSDRLNNWLYYGLRSSFLLCDEAKLSICAWLACSLSECGYIVSFVVPCAVVCLYAANLLIKFHHGEAWLHHPKRNLDVFWCVFFTCVGRELDGRVPEVLLDTI